MKIKIWGARGSIAISNPKSSKYGGNTSCYEIISDCLPKGAKLMCDAGTGFVPAGYNYLPKTKKNLSFMVLFTHWHWDHILGLTLSPQTFIENIPLNFFGPIDNNYGPDEMIRYIFERPFFPIDSKRITHKIKFYSLKDFDVSVIAIHPKAGTAILNLDTYNKILQQDQQIPFNQKKYNLTECLIIKMAKTNHSNSNCISYRFEEKPSGKVFVLLTDHEDMVSTPADFKNHLSKADLLIADAQFSKEKYRQTAGYGHGTPFGCIKQAVTAKAKKIGLTHHDPNSSDNFLEKTILKEAHNSLNKFKKAKKTSLNKKDIFICKDYQEISL